MKACILALLVFSLAGFGQPLQYRTILNLDSGECYHVQFDVADNNALRLLWTQSDASVYTALYNWSDGEFTEEPHPVYNRPGRWSRTYAVHILPGGDWIAVVAESSWVDTCRIVGLTCQSGVVEATELVHDDAPLASSQGCYPISHPVVRALLPRPSTGIAVVLAMQRYVIGDDFFWVDERPGCIFYSDDHFTLQSFVVSDLVFFESGIETQAQEVLSQDSVLLVSTESFERSLKCYLTPDTVNLSPPETLSCGNLYATETTRTHSGHELLFSSTGTYDIGLPDSCYRLQTIYQWLSGWTSASNPDYGGACTGGGTIGSIIELVRVDTQGVYVRPRESFDLGFQYPMTRDIGPLAFFDSTLYGVWTQGNYVARTSLGAYRIGWREPTLAAQEPTDPVPRFIELSAYPNPFNNSVRISYDLPKTGEVRLVVFDVLGRNVETLVNQNMTAGSHSVSWSTDGPSGIYFVQLRAGNETFTQKVILTR